MKPSTAHYTTTQVYEVGRMVHYTTTQVYEVGRMVVEE
jgi:hypothetical protein